MALPPGWTSGVGLPLPSGRRSLRFYVAASATANFADRAYNFAVSPAGGGAQSLQIPPSPVVDPGAEGVTATPISTPMGGHRDVPAANQAAPVTTQAAFAIRICNDGTGVLEYSFDGVNVHGSLKAGEQPIYLQRFEPGIAVRGAGTDTPAFRIEAW